MIRPPFKTKGGRMQHWNSKQCYNKHVIWLLVKNMKPNARLKKMRESDFSKFKKEMKLVKPKLKPIKKPTKLDS